MYTFPIPVTDYYKPMTGKQNKALILDIRINEKKGLPLAEYCQKCPLRGAPQCPKGKRNDCSK